MLVHRNTWRPALDPSSSAPLYEQILEATAFAIASGELAAGDPLPSVRSLAAELRINPNTAARALRELDRHGLSTPLRGVGSVVAEGAREAATPIARRALLREIDTTLAVAGSLGLSLEQTLEAMEQRWKEAHDAARA